MPDLSTWMPLYEAAVWQLFGSRVRFIGLQGSYARGEQGPDSDIDVVLIVDDLATGDVLQYRAALDTLPYRELICGFVSDTYTLSKWQPAELFQFYYDTVPILGRLDAIFPVPGIDAARLAVQNGACTLYHACCHNLLHGRDPGMLPGLYKSAVFTLQALCFVRTGRYFRTRGELRQNLSGDDARILAAADALRRHVPPDCLDEFSDLLLTWAAKLIAAL